MSKRKIISILVLTLMIVSTIPMISSADEPERNVTASIDGPDEGFINEQVQFTASATGGVEPYTFGWDVGGITYDDGDEETLEWTFDTLGNYRVRLRVTDSIGTIDYVYRDILIQTHDITLHVDDDYNENTPGWGITHFDEIQDAIDASFEYYTILVYEGKYSRIRIDKSLTLKAVDGDDVMINNQISSYMVYIHDTTDVIIDGFSIERYEDSEVGIFIYQCENVKVNNVTINGRINEPHHPMMRARGIYVSSSYDIFISNCVIYYCDTGIAFYPSFQYTSTCSLIINNNIHTCDMGIRLAGVIWPLKIYNNILDNNKDNLYIQSSHSDDIILYDEVTKVGNYYHDFEQNSGFPYTYNEVSIDHTFEIFDLYPNRGDFDHDLDVSYSDYAIMLSLQGVTSDDPEYNSEVDMDDNGVINSYDKLLLLRLMSGMIFDKLGFKYLSIY